MRKLTNRDNDSPSRLLARYIKQLLINMWINLVYRNDRFLRGGDHTPFSQNGFTAVRFVK
jgi:hypothetical protein